MQWKWLWAQVLPAILPAVSLAVLWSAVPAHAETVHLNTGESIKGKIVRVDPDSVSIESERGFGVIQIQRGDITLIEYDDNERDLSRLVGVGYYHRATPNSVSSSAAEYGVDALSLKMWFGDRDSVDLQLGFYSADDSAGTVYEVLSVDLRYASVFQRRASLDVYWGASLGFLSVTDRANGVDDTGQSLRAFLGVEFFFVTLPNVGISSEISVGSQSVGNSSTTNLSTTTFPAFSIRYYF